ncbi:MAG: LuxR C-terminal-related transcriptional regulator [Candidatus Accumulibacter necessarius]|jgi:DNA-binding CsgD family transcriptional regulator|uniref:helix-turn-helix transcriptional regulator n=1 Tax=Candidatus Accumulibacter necessarius TaxID=2954386 RepID=UPI002FC39B9D
MAYTTGKRAMSNAQTLNRLILSLYREGREVTLGSFRGWALDQIQGMIAFDSAWWGNAAANPPVLHDMYLHNCERGILDAYAVQMEQDPFRAALLSGSGVAVNLSDLTTRARYVRTPLYRDFARHFKLECALGTLLIEPASSLYEFLIVWRHDWRRPFSEDERQTKELLMPHLVEVHRAVRLRHFLKVPGAYNREWALIDAHGFLREASPAFVARIHRHWPDWRGSGLPEALAACVEAGGGYAAASVRFDVTPCGPLRYVVARADGALQQLSLREREIAARYAQGETHSAIGAALSLSPATVRNHIAHCFKKLGVSNKVELASRLERKG